MRLLYSARTGYDAEGTLLRRTGQGEGPVLRHQEDQLGNGTYASHTDPVTGRPNPGEPTYDNPNSGGYYLSKNGDYRLKDGHGRAMS